MQRAVDFTSVGVSNVDADAGHLRQLLAKNLDQTRAQTCSRKFCFLWPFLLSFFFASMALCAVVIVSSSAVARIASYTCHHQGITLKTTTCIGIEQGKGCMPGPAARESTGKPGTHGHTATAAGRKAASRRKDSPRTVWVDGRTDTADSRGHTGTRTGYTPHTHGEKMWTRDISLRLVEESGRPTHPSTRQRDQFQPRSSVTHKASVRLSGHMYAAAKGTRYCTARRPRATRLVTQDAWERLPNKDSSRGRRRVIHERMDKVIDRSSEG